MSERYEQERKQNVVTIHTLHGIKIHTKTKEEKTRQKFDSF